ncbi:MAG: AAA family ATPase, partial [archaeon]|nr:AAA family ATPase [archaeon]
SKDKSLIDFQHLLNPIREFEDEAYRAIVNTYMHKIPEQKKVVYDTAFDLLDTQISDGKDVIFDATFSKKEMRQRAYETAIRNGLDKVYLVQVVCDADIVKKRLENRANGKQSTTSNAKQLEIFEIIKKEFDSSHVESDNPLNLDISRIVYDTGRQEIMTYGFEDKTAEMIKTDVLNPLIEKYKN